MNGQGQAPGNDDAGQPAPLWEAPSPAKAGEPSPINPPTVSDYELIRRIGHGAYGDVWLARSNATGALRAAKIVWRHTFENERPFKREFEGIQRFERISREHPSQLALFHIGRNDAEGYFFYVMELADAAGRPGEDGGLRIENGDKSESAASHTQPSIFNPLLYTPHTLRADLEKGRLSAAKVLEIGLALSEALSHLHSNGLVHRDVKPSNVIFVNGRPKLADIGLVTDASDQCSIVGTEGYLPPEGPGTPQADIFALGKVLYEAATGLDRRDFPKLPEDLREWPDYRDVVELNEIVLRACAKDPASRYPTCQAMHAELALLGQGKSVRQKRTQEQRWAVAKKVLATTAVFGVLAVGATILWQQSRVARPLSSNPQAEKLYQQAVYEMQSQELERIQQAYTNLAEAVKLDPGFVDGYYKMFETYFTVFGDKLPPHFNQAANVRVVAEKLRMLSPDSAEYHTVDSYVKFQDWKFDEAIEEAALAEKINPNFVRAHGLNAMYFELAHGDAEAALREYRIAERLDPSDVIIQAVMGGPYYLERKYDQAIEQYQRAANLEPRDAYAHGFLATACEANKQYDEAINEYEQFDLLSGEDSAQAKAWYQKMRTALHDKGPRGWWQAQLDDARQDPHADPYWTARLNARVGNTNETFSLLNQAYKEHNRSMSALLEDDCWDPFRADPRFQELLKKIGFRPKD
jgi:serine/threonine protein kinase/Tfp pilus assembly protein PilF